MNQRNPVLAIGGERITGQDARDQNVASVLSISDIIKSSLGPVGLDKMLVDDIGDVTISNDGATILSLLDIEHPAARILVDLANVQDREVGDGTTSVVLVASELLKRANELVKLKIHPTIVISGFRIALKEACKFVVDQIAMKSNALSKEVVISCAKTSLSSKIIGSSGLDHRITDKLISFTSKAIDISGFNSDTDIPIDEFFANLAYEAIMSVKSVNSKGNPVYKIKSINILKAHGKSQRETAFVKGYALNCTVASQVMVKKVLDAKIACLDMDLQKLRMHLGVQVLVNDPEKLKAIREREIEIPHERIKKIIEAGANVILTTKGIDDATMKLFIDTGAMAVRRCKKEDILRIAEVTGATVISTLADLEGDESFDPSLLGHAESVSQERISDEECLIFGGTKNSGCSSIILRGPNDTMLDEIERAVHDALCVMKRVLESNMIVPGGSAVESALSVYLENFATTIGSKEQMAISKFAESLLIIPRTLAVNAAKDATDLVAQLRSVHYTYQSHCKKNSKILDGPQEFENPRWVGLDLITGELRDNVKHGVIEPCISKLKVLKYATEAAISILRIDDLIKIAPEKPVEREGCH